MARRENGLAFALSSQMHLPVYHEGLVVVQYAYNMIVRGKKTTSLGWSRQCDAKEQELQKMPSLWKQPTATAARLAWRTTRSLGAGLRGQRSWPVRLVQTRGWVASSP